MGERAIEELLTPEQLVALALVRTRCATGHARAIRQAARLSMREVGEAVGVHECTIAKWETGDRSPFGDAAIRYGRVLGMLETLVWTGEIVGPECASSATRYPPNHAEDQA